MYNWTLMQEKLDLLCAKYGGAARVAPGDELRLLPWRQERRFTELRGMVNDGTLKGVSALRFGLLEADSVGMMAAVRREMGIARMLYGHAIADVTAFAAGDRALCAIARFDDGVLLTLEVSLQPGVALHAVDKHELTCARGVACDRPIDTQVPQDSIYLYTAGGRETYTDVDYELFGLTPDECAIVRAAYAAATVPGEVGAIEAENTALDAVMAAVAASCAAGGTVEVSK